MMVYSGHSNLKRVSTECGGKSPQLILDDAENIDAIEANAIGIYENAGQVCSAGSRIYVHRSRYESSSRGSPHGRGTFSPSGIPSIRKRRWGRS